MARSDFNGDGRSDIFWRNLDGTFSNWLGNAQGGFVVNDANALAWRSPFSYQVSGVGDFNGDGHADILWRTPGPGGRSFIRESLGTDSGGFVQNDVFFTVAASFRVSGIGDFNGDGRDDVLFRIGSLVNLYFAKAGGHFGSDSLSTSTVATDWKVAGVGDFNGDGRADLLWRNDNGWLSDWLGGPNGFTINDANAFTMVGTDWKVASTGDFNGDGRDDILWRSDTGALSNWLGTANGGFVVNDQAAFRQVSTEWMVAAVGDYNGDGRDDILWRHASGTISDWLGTATGGFIVNDSNALIGAPLDWQVQSAESLGPGWGWTNPFL